MHHFFFNVEHFFRVFALQVPLEIFVLIGSFLEEIISPIPSALIMGTAGSLALYHHEPLWYLLWLALIGNLGKVSGSWLYYLLGDKLEDLLSARAQKFFGIRHEEIQSFGKRFSGHHWKDGGLIFVLRLIPFIPTLPVSVAAGIIKLDLRVFLGASFLGNFFKDCFYLYAGYAGVARLHHLWRVFEPVKWRVDAFVTLGIILFLFFLYTQRGAGRKASVRFEKTIRKFFQK